MIVFMNVNAKIIKFLGKYFPETDEEEQIPRPKSGAGSDAEVALAIAVAFSESCTNKI